MSQFSPPPPPGMPQNYAPYMLERPPWSAAAIGGFVASLLGFLGITAVIGLIFGIIGIMSTKDGRKRGFGLAVAAIPISLIMGLLGVFFVFAFLMFGRIVQVVPAVKTVMALESGELQSAATSLREISSSSLNSAVTSEEMAGWLGRVRDKHGRLTDLKFNPQNMEKSPAAGIVLDLDGKFVNGPATVRMSVDAANPFQPKVDNLEVGDMSLRESAGGNASALPAKPPSP